MRTPRFPYFSALHPPNNLLKWCDVHFRPRNRPHGVGRMTPFRFARKGISRLPVRKMWPRGRGSPPQRHLVPLSPQASAATLVDMTSLPEWMRPPREEGWFADDLDHLPEAPRHTELIDGALVFMMSPQRSWHARVVTTLTSTLMQQAPEGFEVEREMTVRLDRRNRPEPDVLITRSTFDPDRTWHAPEDVVLVIEVVSPESAHRDRTVKLRKYAEAGIPHYWCVEDESSVPVVHVYELDRPTGVYAPAAIVREFLERAVPFEVGIDLGALVPRKGR